MAQTAAETTADNDEWIAWMLGENQTRGKGGKRIFAQTIIVIPLVVCALQSSQAFGAVINTEAASPQRSSSLIPHATVVPPRPAIARARAPMAKVTSIVRPHRVETNAQGDGVPDQVWGGHSTNTSVVSRSLTPTLSPPTSAPSQNVSLNRGLVVSKLNPLTAQSKPIARFEPALTSSVRPQDVAGFQKIGAPYQVNGMWYVPAHEPDYNEIGVASWYGADFQGRTTANGEAFDMSIVSGAHPTLPIPSLVEVTNLDNGRSLVVRINDRGPFVSNRLIDLSARGAELLGYKQQGHTNVRVRYLGPGNSEPMITAQTERARNPNLGAKSDVLQATPTFVQVGTFSRRDNAQRVVEQSATLGLVRMIETQQVNGGPLYRVVLGPISGRTEADVKVAEMFGYGFTDARVISSLN